MFHQYKNACIVIVIHEVQVLVSVRCVISAIETENRVILVSRLNKTRLRFEVFSLEEVRTFCPPPLEMGLTVVVGRGKEVIISLKEAYIKS